MAKFVVALNESPLVASNTARPNSVVMSDSDGSIRRWLPQWQYIHSFTTNTTNSVTDVLMPDMFVTPKAGIYEVEFEGNTGNSVNSNTVIISFYVGGVQIPASKRSVITGAANRTSEFTCATIAVDGKTQIEVRWSVNAGTASADFRTLRLRLIG